MADSAATESTAAIDTQATRTNTQSPTTGGGTFAGTSAHSTVSQNSREEGADSCVTVSKAAFGSFFEQPSVRSLVTTLCDIWEERESQVRGEQRLREWRVESSDPREIVEFDQRIRFNDDESQWTKRKQQEITEQLWTKLTEHVREQQGTKELTPTEEPSAGGSVG